MNIVIIFRLLSSVLWQSVEVMTPFWGWVGWGYFSSSLTNRFQKFRRNIGPSYPSS
jgi:hypothetical protein